jgi:hypothetical protein
LAKTGYLGVCEMKKCYQVGDKQDAIGWLFKFAETAGKAKCLYMQEVGCTSFTPDYVDVRAQRRPEFDEYGHEDKLPLDAYDCEEITENNY